jgi:nucleotide-binding universal stress UspA family protein
MAAFERLLVHVGTEPGERPALDRAAHVARRTGATVDVVTVVEPTDLFARFDESPMRDLLETLAAPLRDQGVMTSTAVLHGAAAPEVARYARDHRSDLVLKFERADDDGRPNMASLGYDLARKCPCPVWIVRPGAVGPLRRVLAMVDPHLENPRSVEIATRVVQTAFDVAAAAGGEVHLVHAWAVAGEDVLRRRMAAPQYQALTQATGTIELERLAAFTAEHASAIPPERVHLIAGDPARTLPAYAVVTDADLVVMATMTRVGPTGQVMGHFAERVVRRFPCSVLAVKAADFLM